MIAPPRAVGAALVKGLAYTSVNGEKSYMDPGDFVTTPSWTWHGHGNEGDGPMVWLDGLDVPFVQSPV